MTRTRSFRAILLPVLIVTGGLVAALVLVISRPTPERVATPRLAPMITTKVLMPRTTPLVVKGTGTVRPTSEITLSAEVGGRGRHGFARTRSWGRIFCGRHPPQAGRSKLPERRFNRPGRGRTTPCGRRAGSSKPGHRPARVRVIATQDSALMPRLTPASPLSWLVSSHSTKRLKLPCKGPRPSSLTPN